MFLVEGVQQHVFYVTLCVTPTRDVSTLGVAPATNVDAGRGILAKEANARREPSFAESGREKPDDTALERCSTRRQRCERLLGSRVRSGGCSSRRRPTTDTARSVERSDARARRFHPTGNSSRKIRREKPPWRH